MLILGNVAANQTPQVDETNVPRRGFFEQMPRRLHSTSRETVRAVDGREALKHRATPTA